jgi:prophage tail gpP-like protein
LPKYSLVIDRKQLNHISNFTIRKSLTQFVDTFSATFGNVNGEMSKNIYLGDEISFMRGAEKIFTGLVEGRSLSAQDGVKINLQIMGRDTICHLTESKAPLINFKNTTDNAIIEKVVSSISNNFEFNLGDVNSISEYTIHPGDSIGQVIDGVAKLNDTFIWMEGDTIIKRKISETGNPVQAYYIENGSDRKNILNITTNEDITRAKTKISIYSHSGGRNKSSLKAESNVDIYSSTNYQKLITKLNGHEGSRARFDRPYSMAASGKNLGEIQRQLDVAVKSVEPKASINLDIKDFQNINLNDIIAIVWDIVGINDNYVVTGLEFKLTGNNQEITSITLQPLGSYPK